MTIKALLGLATFLIVSAWSGVASADAMYVFNGIAANAFGDTYTIHETLTVTDQALHIGHLSFSVSGAFCNPSQPQPGNPCFITGDPTGFVSISDCCFSSTFVDGTLSLGVSFNQDGTLTGGLDLFGTVVTKNISGTGVNWSGIYSADGARCNGPPPTLQPDCSVTGSWSGPTNIPEPSTLMLFVSGIAAGVSLYRLKRRAFPGSTGSAT
jgi:hypothetical protein